MGDEVLQQVSDALARSVREGQDGCYRLGGDEFGVLLRNVSESQAYEILRRGFARVEAARRPNAALSCSVGTRLHSRRTNSHTSCSRGPTSGCTRPSETRTDRPSRPVPTAS